MPPLCDLVNNLVQREDDFDTRMLSNALGSVGTSNGSLKFDDSACRQEKRDCFANALKTVYAHADGEFRVEKEDIMEWHQLLMDKVSADIGGEIRGDGVTVRCGRWKFVPGGKQLHESLDVYWLSALFLLKRVFLSFLISCVCVGGSYCIIPLIMITSFMPCILSAL